MRAVSREILEISVQYQFNSVTQLCLSLCNPMDCSVPGLPVHQQCQELAQTHVHWVGDDIQPTYPVIPFSSYLQSLPASRSFLMSQFFKSGGQRSFSFSISPSTEYSGLISFRIDWLDFLSKGLSRVFSNTTVQKHQFFGAQLSFMVQLSHPCMTTGKNHSFDYMNLCQQSLCFLIYCLSLS